MALLQDVASPGVLRKPETQLGSVRLLRILGSRSHPAGGFQEQKRIDREKKIPWPMATIPSRSLTANPALPLLLVVLVSLAQVSALISAVLPVISLGSFLLSGSGPVSAFCFYADNIRTWPAAVVKQAQPPAAYQ
jgi:hypothetical protein